MFEYKRIFISSDPLMTKEKEQYSNRRWMRDLLSRPIAKATGINVGVLASSLTDVNHIDRRKFFDLSNIEVDLDATQFWYPLESITNASIEYLSGFVTAGDLVIGYELSEQTRSVIGRCGASYIDIWLHPIRFFDDVLFGFNSNDDEIRERLFDFNISEDLMYLYADRVKVQTYKGWRRIEAGLEPHSCLFVGQMLNDKSVCDEGRMLSVLDYKERFDALCKTHSKVYYARHPYLKSGDADVLDYVLSKKNVELADFPVYRALSSYRLKTVASLSSSVLTEAKYFDKNVDCFFKPVFEFGNGKTKNEYSSVYQEFVSPHFWAKILGLPQVDRVMFVEGKDKLRDMLGFYWSYSDVDKLEFTRRRSDELSRNMSGLRRESKIEKSTSKLPEVAVSISTTREPISSESVVWTKDLLSVISKEIDAVKWVSFDIFDTLIERPFSDPSHIFWGLKNIIPEASWDEFISARKASRNLAAKRDFMNGEEVSLLNRYKAVCDEVGLDASLAERLAKAELDLDAKLCRVKSSGKSVFDIAKKKKKKIILISDTYYSSEELRYLLECSGFGFDGLIYSSLDCGFLKHSGKIYSVVLSDIGIEPKNILHFGDNSRSDIEKAKAAGIDAILIPTSRQMCGFSSDYLRGIGKFSDDFSQSVISSLGASKIASEYCGRAKSFTHGSSSVLGYSYLGPMMMGFARQILKDSIARGVKKVFFLARDGDIVKKCYDIISKGVVAAPISEYLYASRRSLNVAGIVSGKDVIDLLSVNFTPCPLDELLYHRFGILGSDVPDDVFGIFGYKSYRDIADWKKDSSRLIGFFSSSPVLEVILKNSKKERANLLDVYDKKGVVKDSEKLAFVDIGHSGTLQASLIKIFNLKSTVGYYFSTNDSVDLKINFSHQALSYYADRLSPRNRSHDYNKYILMFELMFQNKDGSFVKFDDEGMPIFLSVENEQKRVNFICQVHDGIVDFVKDVVEIENVMEKELCYLPEEAVGLYLRFLADPWPDDVKNFIGVGFENKYSGRAVKWIIPPKEITAKGLWFEGVRVMDQAGEAGYSEYVEPAWIGVFARFVKNDRKKAKLRRDPKGFLRDSKYPFIRHLSRYVSE